MSVQRGKSRQERRRILVSWLFSLAIFALALVTTGRYPALSTALLQIAGIVFVAVGAGGRIWCALFIAGYKNSALITVGPYSLCRNPLYLFSLTGAVGVGLFSGTLTLPLLIAGGFFLYYPQIIAAEERRLAGLHGSDYTHYRATTPRLIPDFSGYREPESYTVRPRRFRSHLIDAGWFVLGIALMTLFAQCRAAKLVPTLFHLY